MFSHVANSWLFTTKYLSTTVVCMLPAIFTERIINASNSNDNAIVRAREFEWVIISVYEFTVKTAPHSKRDVITAEVMDAIFFAVSVNTSPLDDGLACKIINCLGISQLLD